MSALSRNESFSKACGYESTVIPQIENAVLSGQDIIFLGERGQAKTRIARQLIELLDASVPAIAGCEINDDPFTPICAACKYRVANDGDSVEIVWLTPDQRYSEKLATPDISIADLIGEVDPSGSPRAATSPMYDDPLRPSAAPPTAASSRSTSSRLASASGVLLNVLEERDIQVRGYQLRLPLDSVVAGQPRTTRTAAGSSRRSRTASARRSARTTRKRSRPRSGSWSRSGRSSSTKGSRRSCPRT